MSIDSASLFHTYVFCVPVYAWKNVFRACLKKMYAKSMVISFFIAYFVFVNFKI